MSGNDKQEEAADGGGIDVMKALGLDEEVRTMIVASPTRPSA